MALFGKVDDDYTKTGKGGLTRWSNGLSYIPFLRNLGGGKDGFLSKIPIIGGTITAVLGYGGTIIEAAQWLFRGKIGSAATVLAAGTASTLVNALPSPIFWVANAISGVSTGETLGTHARALTESVIGGVSGALGAKPTVLSSYPAGIGSINNGQTQQGPGRFLSEAARSRGEDPNAAYARMTSNQADHLAALKAAQAQGGQRAM